MAYPVSAFPGRRLGHLVDVERQVNATKFSYLTTALPARPDRGSAAHQVRCEVCGDDVTVRVRCIRETSEQRQLWLLAAVAGLALALGMMLPTLLGDDPALLESLFAALASVVIAVAGFGVTIAGLVMWRFADGTKLARRSGHRLVYPSSR